MNVFEEKLYVEKKYTAKWSEKAFVDNTVHLSIKPVFKFDQKFFNKVNGGYKTSGIRSSANQISHNF